MHEHDNNCGCGDNHEDEMIVTLTMDDDTEVECLVISIFPLGENDYIALVPLDTLEEEDSEIYLYQYLEHSNDEVELLNIEEDDEFEKVTEAFNKLMKEADESDYFDYDMFEEEDDN